MVRFIILRFLKLTNSEENIRVRFAIMQNAQTTENLLGLIKKMAFSSRAKADLLLNRIQSIALVHIPFGEENLDRDIIGKSLLLVQGGDFMAKDKWINIRCNEQERQDITEQAKQNNMSVAEFFRYLVAKERKEMESK